MILTRFSLPNDHSRRRKTRTFRIFPLATRVRDVSFLFCLIPFQTRSRFLSSDSRGEQGEESLATLAVGVAVAAPHDTTRLAVVGSDAATATATAVVSKIARHHRGRAAERVDHETTDTRMIEVAFGRPGCAAVAATAVPVATAWSLSSGLTLEFS